MSEYACRQAVSGVFCLNRMATLPVPEEQSERPSSYRPAFSEEESIAAKLVGTVEASLAPSTRTRYLTLNAPDVRHHSGLRAYACLGGPAAGEFVIPEESAAQVCGLLADSGIFLLAYTVICT